jgi:hypothetical protein
MNHAASALLGTLVLVGSVASTAGCGSNGNGGHGPVDASSDDASDGAPLDDGAPADAVGDEASDGAAPDGALEAGTLDSGVTGNADASVGSVAVTVDASLVTVSPAGGACAAIESLVVAPSEALVGHALNLTAAGTDASGSSADVSLSWTGPAAIGTLGSTAGSSTTFSCAAAGSGTITVTASLSGGGASCPGTGTFSAHVTCDAP